ncbi:FKBP-type peptidyl-prolyl cis-trans isomerase [Planctobacterium marinum]|uniref:FKBP-type peptidyl-prolyl cis-trans isomerase n=1 Tax=Planctobacterium marinum TaxID=1631968 RepID=UPI001E41DA57|nr:FKBP-type peptidyl-prolyl cis-trans isomerase [Planctobacterium marinum]MCC2606473.1 FKBP-type peptidyl-prolyl cis-trans isomerase [Planctobacterium marinum]
MRNRSLLIALASVIGLSACQQEQSSNNANTDKAAAMTMTIEQVNQLPEAEKQAYALGENMGKYVTAQAEQYAEFGMTFSAEHVKQGFMAAIDGNAILTDEESTKLIQALQAAAQQKQTEMAAVEGQKTLEEGQAYLAENKQREGVMETESGIQYEVLTEGEGEKPSAEDTVKVHYHGTLIDGTVFDSSYDRGEPAVFPLNRVIKGWTEGVQLMNVGSKYRFHIPSELAYGSRATGKIKPNSTLVFDVELLSIESK